MRTLIFVLLYSVVVFADSNIEISETKINLLLDQNIKLSKTLSILNKTNNKLKLEIKSFCNCLVPKQSYLNLLPSEKVEETIEINTTGLFGKKNIDIWILNNNNIIQKINFDITIKTPENSVLYIFPSELKFNPPFPSSARLILRNIGAKDFSLNIASSYKEISFSNSNLTIHSGEKKFLTINNKGVAKGIISIFETSSQKIIQELKF